MLPLRLLLLDDYTMMINEDEDEDVDVDEDKDEDKD
jgi:hypothetical protein